MQIGLNFNQRIPCFGTSPVAEMIETECNCPSEHETQMDEILSSILPTLGAVKILIQRKPEIGHFKGPENFKSHSYRAFIVNSLKITNRAGD